MSEHILLWAAFVLLLVLCLPFSGARKLVLEASCWGLRLALVAALAGGALLWFRPELVPSEAVRVVDASPELRAILPLPGSEAFGLAAAVLLAAIFLPLLAVLDVARVFAGRRLRRLCRLADEQRDELPAAADSVPTPAARPVERTGRHAAADMMAAIGSRKPFRVADQVVS